MPRITDVDLVEARNRLKVQATGFDTRAPYREAIANLSGNRMLELDLDDGETMRGLKLNVNRAAKEINRPVAYGESDTGTLLVWLEEARKTRRRRQTRQPAAQAEATEE